MKKSKITAAMLFCMLMLSACGPAENTSVSETAADITESTAEAAEDTAKAETVTETEAAVQAAFDEAAEKHLITDSVAVYYDLEHLGTYCCSGKSGLLADYSEGDIAPHYDSETKSYIYQIAGYNTKKEFIDGMYEKYGPVIGEKAETGYNTDFSHFEDTENGLRFIIKPCDPHSSFAIDEENMDFLFTDETHCAVTVYRASFGYVSTETLQYEKNGEHWYFQSISPSDEWSPLDGMFIYNPVLVEEREEGVLIETSECFAKYVQIYNNGGFSGVDPAEETTPLHVTLYKLVGDGFEPKEGMLKAALETLGEDASAEEYEEFYRNY